MAHRRQCNQMTGIYRTADNIENLKIKVTFKIIFSLIKIPPFNSLDDETNNLANNDDQEVVELIWQEKRLSFKEIQAYQFKENCKTDLEKKYNQTIKTKHLSGGVKVPGKIFTYTMEDKKDLGDVMAEKTEGQEHPKKVLVLQRLIVFEQIIVIKLNHQNIVHSVSI